MGDIFMPSNPQDWHLTEIEYQKWENHRDEKKDDFPFIALTRAQKRILKKAENDCVQITEKNKSNAYRLREYVLVKIFPAENGNEIVKIRTRGENYLEYLKNEKSKSSGITVRDIIVAIIGATVGFLIDRIC